MNDFENADGIDMADAQKGMDTATSMLEKAETKKDRPLNTVNTIIHMLTRVNTCFKPRDKLRKSLEGQVASNVRGEEGVVWSDFLGRARQLHVSRPLCSSRRRSEAIGTAELWEKT